MEATTAGRRTPIPRRALELARIWVDRYGLIVILLVLPVVYGIQDLQDQGDLSRLASNLKDGLSNGAIWALIALGYTLVYGIIQLINFAHGDLFMIGSFAAVGLYGTVGLAPGNPVIGLAAGLLIVLVITMVVCGVLNAMIERVGYRPLRNAPKLAPLITAVGFSFILQNVGILWLGGQQTAAPDLIQSQKRLFEVAGVSDHAGRRSCDRRHGTAPDPDGLLRDAQSHRQGHEGDGARPGGGAAHGHQRRHHHLVHLHPRWADGGRGRPDLRAVPDDDLVLPGLHRGPDRLHGGGHGGIGNSGARSSAGSSSAASSRSPTTASEASGPPRSSLPTWC